MAVTSMRELQTKVNEISKGMNGIDNLAKLEEAKAIAKNDGSIQELLSEILEDMVIIRSRKDTKRLIRETMRR